MAVEIANVVHAMALFVANDAATLTRADGVTGVTRNGAGDYKLVLAQKLRSQDCVITALIQAPTAPARYFAYGQIDADGDVQILFRSDAGLAADPELPVRVAVLRFPTIA